MRALLRDGGIGAGAVRPAAHARGGSLVCFYKTFWVEQSLKLVQRSHGIDDHGASLEWLFEQQHQCQKDFGRCSLCYFERSKSRDNLRSWFETVLFLTPVLTSRSLEGAKDPSKHGKIKLHRHVGSRQASVSVECVSVLTLQKGLRSFRFLIKVSRKLADDKHAKPEF